MNAVLPSETREIRSNGRPSISRMDRDRCLVSLWKSPSPQRLGVAERIEDGDPVDQSGVIGRGTEDRDQPFSQEADGGIDAVVVWREAVPRQKRVRGIFENGDCNPIGVQSRLW